jgi:multidrug efflux pump subunit AcrA (membrane-fusion protein)
MATLESSREQAAVAAAKGNADLQAPLKASQEKAEFGKRKLLRVQELRKSAAIGQQELDEAETEQRLADVFFLEALETQRVRQLEYQFAAAELALRTIRSPIAGVVVERVLSSGELTRQTPLVKVAQLHPLRIEAFVPMGWMGNIAPGMHVEVQPAVEGAPVHDARVESVGLIVDNAPATFGVRLTLPNSAYRLPAGLACTVHFPIQWPGKHVGVSRSDIPGGPAPSWVDETLGRRFAS